MTQACIKAGLLGLLLASLAGCGTLPEQPARPGSLSAKGPTGDRLVDVSRRYLGVPYSWGGATPQGFDCSGLIYFTHKQLGIQVPRTTREQYRAARRVRLVHVQPGDLLFFSLSRDGISHVGIYAGDNLFIHAPRKGRTVGFGRMDSDYWSHRFVAAGRLY